MTVKYENQLKIEKVVLNKALNQKVLVLLEESIFTGNSGTTHEIVLWSRDKDGNENPDVMFETENILKEQFGDNIKFNGLSPNLEDENEFEVWVQRHKGLVVPTVTANAKGYLQLGDGFAKTSNYGDSRYLTAYTGGKYDPNTQRVRTFEALTPEQQRAYKEANGPGVTSTTRALNFQFEGVVKDVILVMGNKYELKDQVKERSRVELRDQIVNTLQTIPEYEEITHQIQNLNDDYAFSDLIDILGGTNCTVLTKIQDNMMVYAIQTLIENTARTTIRLLVTHSDTGKVFQTTQAKLKKGQYGFGLQFEYLTGDFTANDLNRLIADLGSMGITTSESIEILRDNKIYNPEQNTLSYKTHQDALDTIRLLLNNRKVTLTSFIKEKNSKKSIDTSMMGARVSMFGEYADEQPVYKDDNTSLETFESGDDHQTDDVNDFTKGLDYKETNDVENPFKSLIE